MGSAFVAMGLMGMLTARAADGDRVVADFEGRDYGGWTATGTAFGLGPARGTLPDQMAVSGFRGQGLVNSYSGGDRSTGTLTSPEFRIERPYINMLVGGGAHPGETYLELLVGGKAVRTATGRDSERLAPQTWDVRDLIGRTARIRIVDRHTGGWGHISVDHITQSSERDADEISTAVLYDETYRPQFHFTARKNWLNDPNGLVYYNGEYHLFFQHNPFGNVWGNMHWGHAISRDLVRWTEQPIAIAPDKHGTAFSGSAVVDKANTSGLKSGREDVLVAFYTGAPVPVVPGGPKFTQCLAYSNDRGRTWTKYDKNPILPNVAGENRDPRVFWHTPTGKWIMALYLDGDRFALYESPNLTKWSHMQDIEVPGHNECPDLFELPVDGDAKNTRWVFLGGDGSYLVGRFDGKTFTKESGPHTSDHGASFYATQSWDNAPDGRRIQIAWMRGGVYPGMPFNQQMSFPCDLTLRTTPEGIRLCREPAREIATLREKASRWSDLTLKPSENPLRRLSGDLFDIEAVIEPGEATEVGFTIHGETVSYSVADRKISALGRTAPMAQADGRIRLRLLVDRTSLEVFGQDGQVSMSSCFVPRARDRGLAVYAEGGAARIVSLTVHPLRSAWQGQQQKAAVPARP